MYKSCIISRDVRTKCVFRVMGTTGTGKSSFINLVSGSSFNVGHGLRSCTAAVTMAKPVLIDGVAINLIDTPGFDDTVVNDVDILKMISVYLASTFEHGIKLSGIIYLHRISDQRLGGISRRCFSLFKKLCGEKTMKNVFITTTMWDLISEEIGASREKELTIDDVLFKPALDHGAQMRRHDGAKESAISIIREIMKNGHKALSVQKELVIEGKDITETGAVKEL
ncbi:P-loop containing nucleoside triphosphate hydrolase protein, partial [Abortiporus biennis]